MKASYIPIGMCLGIAIGTAMDNLALGLSLGLCLGVAMSAFVGKRKKSKDENDPQD